MWLTLTVWDIAVTISTEIGGMMFYLRHLSAA